jgi:hypothetical protein
MHTKQLLNASFSTSYYFNLDDDITFLVLNNINPVRIPCILFSTIAMRFIVSYRHKVILTPQVLLCHINTIYLSSLTKKTLVKIEEKKFPQKDCG